MSQLNSFASKARSEATVSSKCGLRKHGAQGESSKIPHGIGGSRERGGLTRGHGPKRKAVAGKKRTRKTGQKQFKARC